MKPKAKDTSHLGRARLMDKKIQVVLFYSASEIIGEENLPFDSRNKDHKRMLNEFRSKHYLLVNTAVPTTKQPKS